MKKEEAKKEIKTELQGGVKLSDENLSVVNAAGETNHGKVEPVSGNEVAGIGGGKRQR